MASKKTRAKRRQERMQQLQRNAAIPPAQMRIEELNALKEIHPLEEQPASTGHGLNLQQGGSTIIWFGLNWSLELYEQANARLWRQGQKETVVVHHLVVKGTMDEQVMQALKDKAAGQDSLMAAVRARIKKTKEA